MKPWLRELLAATGIVAALLFPSCTRQEAADAERIAAEISCAITNAELNDAEITKLCNLTADILNRLQPMLSVHRQLATSSAARNARECQ